jgi:hypothetical protein
MPNISDTEVRALRQKAIELALEVPINNPQNTATVNTASVLEDAQTIYNWITQNKEAAQQ